MSILRLFFYPPLAFARLGPSPIPLDAYFWGPDDVSPRGSGKTSIMPAPTFMVDPSHGLSSYLPDRIVFKDEVGFRPVCPFFELHAVVENSGQTSEQPVTEALLNRHGFSIGNLAWHIEVANLKPFHMTEDAANRVDASIDIAGDNFVPIPLEGKSPEEVSSPLIPIGRHIPLGSVQLIKPNTAFPEVRVRFTPGQGRFYAPSDLKHRWDVDLDDEFLILNPEASWAKWRPSADDARGTPGDQFAQDQQGVSLGMVDDVCDGIISCRLSDDHIEQACARITVGPPDYAPDRRHLVSLADGLTARAHPELAVGNLSTRPKSTAVRDTYQLEIVELMSRIYETAALNNVDVFNQRVAIQENLASAAERAVPYEPDELYAFRQPVALEGRPLPLSDRALQYHRRLASYEVLADFARKHSDIIREMVRPPLDIDPMFDRRMPALMRGGSGHPLHITRRQYDMLMTWLDEVTTLDGKDASGAVA